MAVRSGALQSRFPLPRRERLLGTLTGASLLDDEAGGQERFHDLNRLHAREMASSRSRSGHVAQRGFRYGRALDLATASRQECITGCSVAE